MMKYVHEDTYIEGGVGKWKLGAVKRMAFDFAAGPHLELDTLDGHIRPEMRDVTRDGAVAATDVQQGSALLNLCRKRFGEDARAALMNKCMVPAADPRKRPGGLRSRGHLFQIVIADEGAAADAQHAQEEGCKNHLDP